MNENKITLKLDSKEVPLAQFKSMVTAFFDLIEAVGKEASDINPIQWSIAVREGSQVVVAYAKSEDLAVVHDVIENSIPNGLKILESGCENIPRHFNSRAVKAVRKLASHRGVGDKIIPITIQTGRKRTHITSKTVASADVLIGFSYQSYGSVEGRLRMLADSEGGVKFAIFQKLYKRAISCHVPDELVEDAAMHFRKRVIVSGRIQYDRKGRAISMRASRIDGLPENDALPSLSEVRGILA
jgi:hypothetical protein